MNRDLFIGLIQAEPSTDAVPLRVRPGCEVLEEARRWFRQECGYSFPYPVRVLVWPIPDGVVYEVMSSRMLGNTRRAQVGVAMIEFSKPGSQAMIAWRLAEALRMLENINHG